MKNKNSTLMQRLPAQVLTLMSKDSSVQLQLKRLKMLNKTPPENFSVA